MKNSSYSPRREKDIKALLQTEKEGNVFTLNMFQTFQIKFCFYLSNSKINYYDYPSYSQILNDIKFEPLVTFTFIQNNDFINTNKENNLYLVFCCQNYCLMLNFGNSNISTNKIIGKLKAAILDGNCELIPSKKSDLDVLKSKLDIKISFDNKKNIFSQFLINDEIEIEEEIQFFRNNYKWIIRSNRKGGKDSNKMIKISDDNISVNNDNISVNNDNISVRNDNISVNNDNINVSNDDIYIRKDSNFNSNNNFKENNFGSDVNALISFLSASFNITHIFFIRRLYFRKTFFNDPSFFDHDLERNWRVFEEEDFQRIRSLGGGALSKILLSFHKRSHQFFVIKKYITNMGSEERYQRERGSYEIFERDRHPTILPCYGYINKSVFISQNQIVLKYIPIKNCEILNRMKYFNNSDKTKIVLSALFGIDYLHSIGFIYRDLKLSNILVGPNDEIYLSDFDTARSFDCNDSSAEYTHDLGTYYYKSAEMWGNEDYTYTTDVFSLGILIYELVKEKPMYEIFTITEWNNILKKKDTKSIELQIDYGSIIHLYNKCIKFEKNKRNPSFLLLNKAKKYLFYYQIEDDHFPEFFKRSKEEVGSFCDNLFQYRKSVTDRIDVQKINQNDSYEILYAGLSLSGFYKSKYKFDEKTIESGDILIQKSSNMNNPSADYYLSEHFRHNSKIADNEDLRSNCKKDFKDYLRKAAFEGSSKALFSIANKKSGNEQAIQQLLLKSSKNNKTSAFLYHWILFNQIYDQVEQKIDIKKNFDVLNRSAVVGCYAACHYLGNFFASFKEEDEYRFKTFLNLKETRKQKCLFYLKYCMVLGHKKSFHTYGEYCVNNGFVREAMVYLKIATKLGVMDSAGLIALINLKGDLIPFNVWKSLKYLKIIFDQTEDPFYCIQVFKLLESHPIYDTDENRPKMYYLDKAIESGDCEACLVKYKHLLMNQEYEKSKACLETAIGLEGEYLKCAQRKIGKKYLKGDPILNIEQDISKGIEFIGMSADNGDFKAQYIMAKIFLTSNFNATAKEIAIDYLISLAENGYSKSFIYLYYFYKEANISQSVDAFLRDKFLRLSADYGDINAQILQYQASMKENNAKDVTRYLLLAANNTRKASSDIPQKIAGLSFLNEKNGFEFNLQKGLYFLALAAEHGNLDAKLIYCELFVDGVVPEKEAEKVVYQLLLPIHKEKGIASELLYEIFQNGIGIKKDQIKAKYFLEKSGYNGYIQYISHQHNNIFADSYPKMSDSLVFTDFSDKIIDEDQMQMKRIYLNSSFLNHPDIAENNLYLINYLEKIAKIGSIKAIYLLSKHYLKKRQISEFRKYFVLFMNKIFPSVDCNKALGIMFLEGYSPLEYEKYKIMFLCTYKEVIPLVKNHSSFKKVISILQSGAELGYESAKIILKNIKL